MKNFYTNYICICTYMYIDTYILICIRNIYPHTFSQSLHFLVENFLRYIIYLISLSLSLLKITIPSHTLFHCISGCSQKSLSFYNFCEVLWYALKTQSEKVLLASGYVQKCIIFEMLTKFKRTEPKHICPQMYVEMNVCVCTLQHH